ncbi:MAG: hypothetical protein IJS60_00305 [Abditibacteriota bacterium]|nr:hypothetical protein [Abditibacteriota bacterium]
MDILNYTVDKEAFENNFGSFYYVTNKTTGEKCVLLKISDALKDEKYLDQVALVVNKGNKPIPGALFMRTFVKEGEDWFGEYEYFEGKPMSFVMSQKRNSATIKKMLSDLASVLDGFAGEGISYGGLTPESVISCVDGSFKIIGAEFYNTEYKLEGNEDIYNSGYADPKAEGLKFTNKSDIYSLARLTATMFLAEKFYTTKDYPIPNIATLKPIQASIDQAVKTDEKFDSCGDFVNSLVDFKGSCPFIDHGSQVATYVYVVVVVLIIILDWCANTLGWFGGSLGG